MNTYAGNQLNSSQNKGPFCGSNLHCKIKSSNLKIQNKNNSNNFKCRDQLPDSKNVYHQIFKIGNYTLQGLTLGKGNFAKVMLATHKIVGAAVALKIIDVNEIKEKYVLQNLEREVRILSRLNHPNIIKFYEAIWCNQLYCISLEYVRGEHLGEYMKRLPNQKLKEKEAKDFFRQILSAVGHMHRNGVLHRDLKLDNIMLDNSETIKIVDFGLSNFYDCNHFLRTRCGSPEYAAPELFTPDIVYGPGIDMWSLGVILYVMLIGHVPFPYSKKESKTLEGRRRNLHKKSSKGLIESHKKYMQILSESCCGLIIGLLQPNQSLRMNLEIAERHAWLYDETDMPITSKQPNPRIYRHFHPMVTRRIATLTSSSLHFVEKEIKIPHQNFYAMYHILMDLTVKTSMTANTNSSDSLSSWNTIFPTNAKPFYPLYHTSRSHTSEDSYENSNFVNQERNLQNEYRDRSNSKTLNLKNKQKTATLKTNLEENKSRDENTTNYIKKNPEKLLNKLNNSSYKEDNNKLLFNTIYPKSSKNYDSNVKNQIKISSSRRKFSDITLKSTLSLNTEVPDNKNISNVRPQTCQLMYSKNFRKNNTIRSTTMHGSSTSFLKNEYKKRDIKDMKTLSTKQALENCCHENEQKKNESFSSEKKIAILKRPTQIRKHCDKGNLNDPKPLLKEKEEKIFANTYISPSKNGIQPKFPKIPQSYTNQRQYERDLPHPLLFTANKAQEPYNISSKIKNIPKSSAGGHNVATHSNKLPIYLKDSLVPQIDKSQIKKEPRLPILNIINPRWQNIRQPNYYQKINNYSNDNTSQSYKPNLQVSNQNAQEKFTKFGKSAKQNQEQNYYSPLTLEKKTQGTRNIRKTVDKPFHVPSTSLKNTINSSIKYNLPGNKDYTNFYSKDSEPGIYHGNKINRYSFNRSNYIPKVTSTKQQIQTNSRTKDDTKYYNDKYKDKSLLPKIENEFHDYKPFDATQSFRRYSVIRNQKKEKPKQKVIAQQVFH